MRKVLLLTFACALSLTAMAQRFYTAKLDRALVAVPASSGNFVSWRVLPEEYYDVTYNLYCNGTLLKEGLTVSNYTHTSGNASSQYQVAAVVKGVEQDKCAAVTRWTGTDGALVIPVEAMTGRDGSDVDSHYTLNDVSLGDLTGDGIVEFIVKRPCDDAYDTSQSNRFNVLDCYDRNGNRLWWIDMGPNMISGPDEQWDCVCFDWDQDGKDEVLLRGADNMIIHYSDGTTFTVGSTSVDTRSSLNTSSENLMYTNSGNEYLLYLEGATGKPYPIGEGVDGAPSDYYIDYPNPRGTLSDWGDTYGHRATKHYFGAPYLDGRHPSIFLGRGCYTKHYMKAFDVDPDTHHLTPRWAWECTVSSSPWYGQGYHNFQIADVDWDGRDEIMFGAMVIDDNGMGLSTTGYGHGDSQHCSNFDPYTHGQQQFVCCEDNPNNCYSDATTANIRFRSVGTSDDGRALMGNFTNDYPGSVGRSVNTGWISSVKNKVIDALGGDDFIDWSDLNQRIYWDGDLCDEYFDSPGTARAGVVYKPGTGARLAQFSDTHCNNSSKNNPGAIADIFGDWRDEVVMSQNDNKAILVFSTNIATSYRLPTLMSDHQYRNAIVWQSMGYNQTPHKSYFVGQMEGITVAPPPLTMEGRTEVANGGTISTTDEHLIVCEMNDTKVSIAANASPYMVTFYVPSWVQGNAASNTTSKPDPTYEYFTCDVTGGPLTGSTRVVKQGDGILNFPKVDMTYTGETNIWAGTLNFDGTLKNSSLWLNRFAELNSDGGTFRSIKADYGSIIRPGGEGSYGTITTDTLAMGFGSRLQLEVSSDGTQADQVSVSLLTIETKTGSAWESFGPDYLAPVIEIVPQLASGVEALPEGTYTLGTISTVDGDISDIKIDGLAGMKKSLSLVDGKLVLTVAGTRGPSTAYWVGAESTTWDTANAENFNVEGETGSYVSGDDVVFDDAATSFTVSLADELYPSSVTVNSSKTYTFKGTGSLAGEMTFTKDGTGSLTMGNDNTYTGTNTISGGTVRVSSLSNSTQAYGNLGAVGSSNIVIENGATLQATSAVSNDKPIKVQGDGGGVINASSDFSQNAAISGTTLTKSGSGTLKLYKANSSLDTLLISAGAAEACSGTPAKTVVFEGGTLYDDVQSTSHAIYVPKGSKGTWYLTTEYYTAYANKLTGEGTLTIEPRNTVNRVRITGDWSNFNGTINFTNTSICLPLDMSTSASHATLNIGSGAFVANTAKTLTIGAVTGSGTLEQPVSDFKSQADQTGTNTWQIGNSDGNDFTFEGAITDVSSTYCCAFAKVGDCKMTFKGTGSFHGTARVNAGELCLNSTGTSVMLGSGTLTVAKGGTLSGKGVLGNSTVTVSSGGTIRSGVSETSSNGELQFSGKNLTVNGTAQTYVASQYLYSTFTGIGTLKLNGTLLLKGKDGLALAEGTEIQLFEASAITLGDGLELDLCEPNASQGYTWDTSRLDEGVLVVGPAPESVQSIHASSLDDADIYTLSGMKVQGKPRRAGIYIVDGVKTLLK
ncbi:MAG: autotransporter-associated beta strand repeat-containing protein [Prevotellaceae bacterium]|nr:autotransporter-associated beta strand repeat-containing protein [Prevotellaceae bacterium]